MNRKISTNRISECYDEIGENISIISYNRHSMKKVMSAKGLNVFEAFREVLLRSTKDTICIITKDLPDDLVEYNDVKNYELKIEDYYFGQKLPKDVKIKREQKIETLIGGTISEQNP